VCACWLIHFNFHNRWGVTCFSQAPGAKISPGLDIIRAGMVDYPCDGCLWTKFDVGLEFAKYIQSLPVTGPKAKLVGSDGELPHSILHGRM
jgi:hypothetical protein